MKGKIKKLLLIVVAVAAAFCLSFLPHAPMRSVSVAGSGTREAEDSMKDSGLNYTESTENILNPDRGFYYPYYISVTRNPTEALYNFEWDHNYIKDYSMAHIRFGLEYFSSNAKVSDTEYGTDGDITAAALNGIEKTFETLRAVGKSAIIRFSYDLNGNLQNNEPSMELIERHIAQLGEVISRNLDVIVGVETGMLGPWGEQHTTTLANSGQRTYYRLVQAWLDAVPECRSISVRQPLYYRYWANEKYGLNLTKDNMNTVEVPYEDAKRVGMYNDGYLGSSTDFGTFSNREVETAWLNTQATHVLYGGEVITDGDVSSPINNYNNAEYLEQEAFITHTSYLNRVWNKNVVDYWAEHAYTGNDPVYRGKTQYDYIAAHLGYRFVLRESKLSQSADRGGTFRLTGKIENVGFGNVVNEKTAYIMLVSGSNTYVCPTDFDVRKILSKQTASYDMSFNLPSNVPQGTYNVYMRIRDNEEKTQGEQRGILFANVNGYDETLRANKLGTLTVSNTVVSQNNGFTQIGVAAPTYKLTFSAESGVSGLPQAIEQESGKEFSLPASVPTKTGYEFAGWSDGKNVYAAGSAYSLSQNTTLTATWKKATFTVTFDADGGTLKEGEAVQQVLYKEAATAPTFEKAGHEFLGWDKEFDSVESDVTVKALWKADVFTVRFVSKEEATLQSGEASQDVEYGKAATPPVYTREGYKLVGWTSDNEGEDYNEIKDYYVFYAVWEKETESGGKKGCMSSALGTSAAVAVAAIGASAVLLTKRKRVNNK